MTPIETMRDILGRMHVAPPHPADVAWLTTYGLHVLDGIAEDVRAIPATCHADWGKAHDSESIERRAVLALLTGSAE